MHLKITTRTIGLAMLCAGVALFTFPFVLASMQGSSSGGNPPAVYPPTTYPPAYSGNSSNAGGATTFRSMSNNIVQASSGFGFFGWGGSNSNPGKLNAAHLQIDSVDTFDGGYTPTAPQPYQAQPVPPSDAQGYPYYKDTGRDEFPQFDENGVKAVKSDPVSTFAIDVDTASYSFIRRSLNEGQMPQRLPLLIQSFKLMLNSLQPDDIVGIVTYAGNAGVALEPTPASDKARIIRVLDSLQAYGSTAGSEGIRTAYELAARSFLKDGNNRVILATDGDFNVGISSQDELKAFIEKRRDDGIFLSTMGFGMGNYHDTTMQTLAQNGNGNAAYIDTLNEARKVLVDESSSTLFAIAKDVKIQVEFNPALVQEYRLIGYETRHLNREDFNNDKIDAGEIGAGHSATAIYEITPVGVTPLVDDLRYGPKEKAAVKDGFEKAHFTNEYAFLKIRYKRPDQDASKLMTRPITPADDRKFDDLPDDLRFAAAVAEFGELLHDSKYSGTFKWDDVAEIANAARGNDEFGYRQEFMNLVRLAKSEWAEKK